MALKVLFKMHHGSNFYRMSVEVCHFRKIKKFGHIFALETNFRPFKARIVPFSGWSICLFCLCFPKLCIKKQEIGFKMLTHHLCVGTNSFIAQFLC